MPQLKNTPIDTKIQLALLWTSLMFCYIYCDYFDLYMPDKVKDMMALNSVLDNSWKIFAVSVMMAISSLMIFLSVTLEPKLNRILNISFGIFFS